MEELNDMFINRTIVFNNISDAIDMNIQLDDGDGNMLSIVEQIEYAKKITNDE